MSRKSRQQSDRPGATPSSIGSNQETPESGSGALANDPFWKKAWRWTGRNNSQLLLVVALLLFAVNAGLWVTGKAALTYWTRAFMYCKEAIIVGGGSKPREPTQAATLAVSFRNSGKTPARKVAVNVNFCSEPDQLPQDFSYPLGKPQPPMLVAPEGTAQVAMLLPESLLLDIETNKRKMFVYGDVLYKDIFNTWHKTEFCLRYGGFVLNEDNLEIKTHLFFNCEQHNCDDKDCPEKWGSNDAGCRHFWEPAGVK